MFRLGDKEGWITRTEDKKLLIGYYALDLTDEPEPIWEFELPILYECDLGEIENKDKIELDFLFDFYKDVVNELYPVSAQFDLQEKLPYEVKEALKNFCQNESCICSLAFTVGCVNVEKLISSLRKSLYGIFGEMVDIIARKKKKEESK